MWVALELPPLEKRWDKLEQYPQDIGSDMDLGKVNADERYGKIERAKQDIARRLMRGDLKGQGLKYVRSYHVDQCNDEFGHLFMYTNTENMHSEIPLIYWQIDDINWQRSSLSGLLPEQSEDTGDLFQYIEVRIATQDLYKLFPAVRPESDGDIHEPRKRRGRKPLYDSEEFFILCALDAARSNPPETQADFVKRMGSLLSIVWGEGRTPELTWLKGQFNKMKEFREVYERGRRALDEDGIGDRS